MGTHSARMVRHAVPAAVVMLLAVVLAVPGGPAMAQAWEKVYHQTFDLDGLPPEWAQDRADPYTWQAVAADGSFRGSTYGRVVYRDANWGQVPFELEYVQWPTVGTLYAEFCVGVDLSGFEHYYAVAVHTSLQGETALPALGLGAGPSMGLAAFRPGGPSSIALFEYDDRGYPDPLWMLVEWQDIGQYWPTNIDVRIVEDRGHIKVWVHPTEGPYIIGDPPVIDYADPVPLPQGTIAFEVMEDYAAISEVTVSIQRQFPPLSGYVYATDPAGGGSRPLAGAPVSLYCSNDAGYRGKEVATTYTDSQGAYSLQPPGVCEYYGLVAGQFQDYSPAYVKSSGGAEYQPDWIQLAYPLEGKVLDANYFWLQPPVVLPNLVVSSVGSPEFGDNGTTLWVTALIQNVGGPCPGSVDVRLSDAQGGAWPDAAQTIGALDPGASATVTFGLPVPDDQRGTTGRVFAVDVDPKNSIQEQNDADNRGWTPRFAIPPIAVSPSPTTVTPTPTRITPTPSPTHRPTPTRITPTPSPTPRPSPTSTPSLPFAGWIDWWPALAAAALLLGGGGLALALRRPPPKRQPSPAGGALLPPVRLIRLWLTRGAGGSGPALPDNKRLTVGGAYTLHVQAQPRGRAPRHAPAPPPGGTLPLDVVILGAGDDVTLDRDRGSIDLSPSGASSDAQFQLRPVKRGRARLRVCVFYQNRLLQSAVLEAPVGRRGRTTHEIDYVASAHLAGLQSPAWGPAPSVTIVTNQSAVDNSHWIGVWTDCDTSGWQLKRGQAHRFSPNTLNTLTGTARGLLAQVEGAKADYHFRDLLLLDKYNHLSVSDPAVEARWKRRETDFCELARQGYVLYGTLFLLEPDAARRDNLLDALPGSAVISVARCRDEHVSLPWAMIYDLQVDTDPNVPLRLCRIFHAQLANNRWAADQSQLVEQHDLLEQPQRCRANPNCPLKGADREVTVCPFGFWGFTHQIEQPLQQVTPTPDDQIPPELQGHEFEQSSWIEHAAGQPLHAAALAYADLDKKPPTHQSEIEALAQRYGLSLTWEADTRLVKARLKGGGENLYYFYCHGRMEKSVFRLQVGLPGQPGLLSALDLDPRAVHWPEHPLVVLNGCETLELVPERIHNWMQMLRILGAGGVVGTEVPVWTELARPFGLLVLRGILERQSVGEAFLAARLHLLRQLNPLGLAYTFYAPAGLHAHDAPSCAWCQAHPAVRTAAPAPPPGLPAAAAAPAPIPVPPPAPAGGAASVHAPPPAPAAPGRPTPVPAAAPPVSTGGGAPTVARVQTPAPAQASLQVAGVRVPLKPGLTVGRDPASDVRLDDDLASRHHARFELAPAGWVVVDLGSTNGTLVNGQRIQQHVLHEADDVQIGNTHLRFHA